MRALYCAILVLCIIDSVSCCGKKRRKRPQQPTKTSTPVQEVVERMVGKDVKTNPYTAGSDTPGECNQLKCNLDDSSSCCWTNAVDQLNWASATGQGEPAKLQSSFGTSSQPSGNYFVTASDTAGSGSQNGDLYSCPITCAGSDITVKMKHWQSAGTKIQVCTEKDPGGPASNCKDLPSGSGNSDSVTIPKGDPNTRLVIRSTGFTSPTGSVAMLDDIEVTCETCATTAAPTAAPPVTGGPTPAGPTPAPAGAAPCKQINCDFEQGNTCSYQPASSSGGASDNWGTHSAVYMNRLTGVPKDSGDGKKFAAAYTKKKGEKSVLKTDANFDKDYVVRYKYYKATEGQTFKCCCNDESNCPKDTGGGVQTADYKAWKTEAISCPAGTKSVQFVCENLEGASEGACGLDKIELLQSSGGNPSDANQPAC